MLLGAHAFAENPPLPLARMRARREASELADRAMALDANDAVALALKENPRMNRFVAGRRLYQRNERAITEEWNFVGMGVSGGSEGALLGPSMMPGGDFAAWLRLQPVLADCMEQTNVFHVLWPASRHPSPKLRALVEWTAFGIDAVRNRGFTYLSAEYHEDWRDNERGDPHGCVLLGAGLTTRPVVKNLDRVALSAADPDDEIPPWIR